MGHERISPQLPASPSSAGVAGRAVRTAETRLPASYTGSRPIHTPAPSWASIVRDGARANHTAVSRHDFLTLYERCIDSGLRTRLILRHQAGSNEISISCRLNAPPADVYAPPNVRRRRRRRKRAPAAAPAVSNPSPPLDSGPSHKTAPSPQTTAPREAPSPAEAASPPAKRTRKAARRRCELELLRYNDTDDESDDDLHLSPASQARQTTPIDSEPTPVAQPTPVSSPVSSPTTPTSTTPAPPSLQAESPAGQPPPPSPPTTPPDKEEPTRAPAGPPPPPPWSDAFSTDPDQIICRKCCKRSYVFRWYSHCYLCHISESKT
jgi:hypothetical protein